MGVNYRSDSEAADAVVEEITNAGGRAKALQGDVSDPATADALFTALEEEFGPVLVLVNNAGIARGRPRADDRRRGLEHASSTPTCPPPSG